MQDVFASHLFNGMILRGDVATNPAFRHPPNISTDQDWYLNLTLLLGRLTPASGARLVETGNLRGKRPSDPLYSGGSSSQRKSCELMADMIYFVAKAAVRHPTLDLRSDWMSHVSCHVSVPRKRHGAGAIGD
eukprot:5875675-Pyramimonas_sp.AAC.1